MRNGLLRRLQEAVPGERAALAQAAGFTAATVGIGGWMIGFPALLFSAALLGGLALWVVVFLGRSIDPLRILPSYLVTTALFVVHVGEEYAAHMELVLSKISGFQVPQSSFLVIAAFVAPTTWILGGALIAAGKPFGRFIMSTFYFGMIIGEPTHFLFPFMTDGQFGYSAGMVTAVPLVLSALYAFWIAVRSSRRSLSA